MDWNACKCSENAGPQYIKVLHEAHVSVVSILQNQFRLYLNKLNSTHTASCFLSLHTTLKLSEVTQMIRITIYSYTQLNNNDGTGTQLWRRTWKIMKSNWESINEGKRGNPTAWCEADERAKDTASNEFWIFNRHTHWEDLLTRFHFQGKVLSEIWITFWTSIACKWKILLLEFKIILFVSTVYCFPFLLLSLTLTDCLWHVQS